MDDVAFRLLRELARHRQGPLRHRLRPRPGAGTLVAAVWRHRASASLPGSRHLPARPGRGRAAGEGCPERPAADYPSDQPRAAGAHRRRGRRVEARGQDAAAERSGERHAARGRDGSGARRCRHRGALIQSQRTDFRDSSLVASTKPTDFRVGPPAPGTGSPPGSLPYGHRRAVRRSRRVARSDRRRQDRSGTTDPTGPRRPCGHRRWRRRLRSPRRVAGRGMAEPSRARRPRGGLGAY